MYNSVRTADTKCIAVDYKGIKLYKLYEETYQGHMFKLQYLYNFFHNLNKFSLYKYIKM